MLLIKEIIYSVDSIVKKKRTGELENYFKQFHIQFNFVNYIFNINYSALFSIIYIIAISGLKCPKIVSGKIKIQDKIYHK